LARLVFQTVLASLLTRAQYSLMTTALRILQVNASDLRGGAAVVAYQLHEGLRSRGHRVKLYVSRKSGTDTDVHTIPQPVSRWTNLWQTVARRMKGRNTALLSTAAHWLSDPARHFRRIRGLEEFEFPGSRQIDIDSFDVIHCHILHGGYFDLQLLQRWSKRRPVVITLHDAWLLAGHCAHSFACERWLTGCLVCPDISIPIPLEHDNASRNWIRKKRIYEKSRLYVTAPCRWLLDKAERSTLRLGTRFFRQIGHGVDLTTFHARDRMACRADLGLPADTVIFLFAANGIRKNRWKDYGTLEQAMHKLGEMTLPTPVLFLALGETGKEEHFGPVQVRFVPYLESRETVAKYYAASNAYIHPARAETFPNAIMEAMASGVPVVASAVGGIPEQVCNLDDAKGRENAEPLATGVLVRPEDADSLAQALYRLLQRPDVISRLGDQALDYAVAHFNVESQLTDYERFYLEVAADFAQLKS
jgi:glycosyltransferase involved in cell wall biosynthesis